MTRVEPEVPPAARHIEVFSPNPSKRAAEIWYLRYTLVWGAISGLVMLSGVTDRMGDAAYLVFGVGLWLGLLVPPFVRRFDADRGVAWHATYHAKFQVWMFIFAFLGNYWTQYFYEVLHMQYGFPTEWNVNDVPFFLYFLTVCYFTTYGTLINIGLRMARSLLADKPEWVARLASLPVCFAVAGLETALNANPFIGHLFCYDDLAFMLWFGTIMYGTWFVIASPFWFRIDEQDGVATPWSEVLVTAFAAWALVQLANEAFENWIAPLVTEVQHGAIGMGNWGRSCLRRR